MSEIPLSSFTIELLMMGEKRFIWELNLCRILGVLVSVISNDTRQPRTYSTTPDEENDSELLVICEIFQGVGVSGWELTNSTFPIVTFNAVAAEQNLAFQEDILNNELRFVHLF